MPVTLLPVDEGPPIRVDETIVLVGRHPSCDVVIRHSLKVSRKHCCLVLLGDRCLIRDLGSLNGVWVNGRRIEREAFLKPGDEVAIADVKYVVQRTAGEEDGRLPPAESGLRTEEPASFPDYPIPISESDESDGTAKDEAAGGPEDDAQSQQPPSSSNLYIPIDSAHDDPDASIPLADP